VMARSLVKLAVYFEKGRYREIAQRAFEVMGDLPVKYSSSFTNWSILRLELLKGPVSAVFVGDEGLRLRKELGKYFTPFVIIAGQHLELPLSANLIQHEKSNVYICTDNQCYPPTDSVVEIKELLGIVS